MSWVVSLGAGRGQIPLIRAIQAEGFKCWAFDSNFEAVGQKEADWFLPISNRDTEELYTHIIKNDHREVIGVLAAGSEVPDVIAILAHRLGLPGVPVAAGMLLKDKLAYKEVLKAAGVPHTEAHAVYEGCAKTIFDKLGYEVVVKPQRGSGSRGVSIVRHAPMELQHAYRDAEAVCPDVIMERYQPGPQISAETLIWDGIARTVAFVDRFYESFGKEVGGSTPSEWACEYWESNRIIENAAKAFGITHGTIKSDLVLTKNGPKIIEMTCRLSGGPLSEIVKQSTGIDYLRQAVRIACGKEPAWERMTSTKQEKVAMDMNGNWIEWGLSRKYIIRELV